MDPISEFVFSLPPIVSIAMVALLVTLFTSLVYKFVTDQNMMKILKKELKDLQKMMKEHRDKPEKVMALQKKAMEKNMEYMRHSMRPTLFTMIPLILLFGWLNSHIAYYPLMPGETFEVWADMRTGAEGFVELEVYPPTPNFEILSDNPQEISEAEVRWMLRGPEGEYLLRYTLNDETVEQEIIVTGKPEYRQPTQQVRGEGFRSLNVGNQRVEPLSFIGLNWSWIWSYILLSILFSTIIRKSLKIH